MSPRVRSLAEALVFAGAVILYIWILRFRWPWTAGVLALAVPVSLLRHSETIHSAGLDLRVFLVAMRAWKSWMAVAAAAALLLGGRRVVSAEMLHRGLLYLIWCVVQQLVYQTMVYRRLREALGASWRAWALSGVLFAAAHLPNPVLAPATLAWGMLSSRWFERRPSVPALGVLQFLFSTVLLFLTPVEWHRNFRVGASYLRFP